VKVKKSFESQVKVSLVTLLNLLLISLNIRFLYSAFNIINSFTPGVPILVQLIDLSIGNTSIICWSGFSNAIGWKSRIIPIYNTYLLQHASNLSIGDLLYFPLSGIIISPIIIYVTLNYIKDIKLSSILILIINFDPTFNLLSYSMLIHGWGFMYFFYFLLLINLILNNYTKFDIDERIIYSFLLLLLLLASYFSYYSALLYNLIYLTLIVISSFGINLFLSEKNKITKYRLLTIVIFLIVLAILWVLFFKFESVTSIGLTFFSDQGMAKLLRLPITLMNKFFSNLTGDMFELLSLINYVLILFPCIIFYLKLFLDKKWSLRKNKDNLIVSTSLILLFIINVAFYFTLNLLDMKLFYLTISFSFIFLVKQIIGLLTSDMHRSKLKKNYIWTLLILVLLTNVGRTSLYLHNSNTISYQHFEIELETNNFNTSISTISDILFSEYMTVFNLDHYGQVSSNLFFNSDYYNRLIQNGTELALSILSQTNTSIFWIVLDEIELASSISGGLWQGFPGLLDTYNNLTLNGSYQRVSSPTSRIIILQYVG